MCTGPSAPPSFLPHLPLLRFLLPSIVTVALCGSVPAGAVAQVSVTPDGGSVSVPINTGDNFVDFEVEYSEPQIWDVACTVSGKVDSCTPDRAQTQNLPDMGGVDEIIRVYFDSGDQGTGTVTLQLTGASCSRCLGDTGYFDVTVVAEGPPVVDLKNYNGDNMDRSQCLVTGAGEAGAAQCGDLLITHAMPEYPTMGRNRALTLVYSSAQGSPEPLVVALVEQPSALTEPDSVIAELRVGGVLKSRAGYNGWIGGSARQIAISYDAAGDGSGVYPFTLTIRNLYASTMYEDTLSGNFLVVDRSTSPFGRGWWPAGVERLRTGQPDDGILWVGADGSAKLYGKVATDTWVAPAGTFRDTLRYDSGTGKYTRTARHGVQVEFGGGGRHLRTIARTDQESVFSWTGSPKRLTSIQVPPSGVSGTTYTLSWDGSNKLDAINDPAGRTLNASVSGGSLVSLTDPDGESVSFGYGGSGRLTSRTTRRGYQTSYSYANGLRLTRVDVPLTLSDTASTRLFPWDEKGLATGSDGQVAYSGDVYTRIQGPRTTVVDEVDIWVDRWGAPTKIVDPLNHTTLYWRDDPDAPAMVSRMREQNGRVVTMEWNARANLTEMRDSTSHLGSAGLPTAVSQWQYNATYTKDAPSRSIDPMGLVTDFTYNSWGVPSKITNPNGHVTDFDHIKAGSKKGLLRRVRELSVDVYNEGTETESTINMPTRFGFNSVGNITSDTSALGHVRLFQRDSAQRVHDFYDAEGHRTTFVHDPLNRVIEQIEYAGGSSFTTEWHYGIDVLDSIVDPRGVVRAYEYDRAGRQTAMIDDYGNREERTYDEAGLLTSMQPRFYEGGSSWITHIYDAAGQKTKTVWPAYDTIQPADSVVNSYDNMGRLDTAMTAERKIVRSYYANGLLKSEVQSAANGTNPFAHAYAYNNAGQRTSYVIGGSGGSSADSVSYSYNGDGELATIAVRWRSGVRDSVQMRWDALGRRDSLVYSPHQSNPIRVAFAYDRDGHMRRLCSRHSAPSLYHFKFRIGWQRYDDGVLQDLDTSNDATCTTQEAPVSGANYTYDGRHQMLTQGGADSTVFAYDGSGNMTERQSYTGSTMTKDERFHFDPGHNRLTKKVYDASDPDTYREFGYDDNGARIDEVPYLDGSLHPSPTTLRYYAYDGLGRTTGTGEPACTQDSEGDCIGAYYWVDNSDGCGYDPLGRQWDPCENVPVTLGYDGDNVVRTAHDGSSGAWTFVHGPGTDDPLMGYHDTTNDYIYFVTDGKGRQYVVGKIDGSDYSGENLYRMGGKFAGGITSAHSFGATRNDNPEMKQLSFFRNRFYDQETGRWTQEDPLGMAAGTNLYQYVGNNPGTLIDPFGLCPEPEDKDGTVCLALFIQSESALGLKGDGRGFSSSSDPSQSRVWVHVNPGNQSVSVHVNPTCTTGGNCNAPLGSNQVNVSFGSDGGFTVSVNAKNSILPGPAINGTFAFTPDGQGGYATSGNRDAFPSAEAYSWRSGQPTTLFQRPERSKAHLLPFMPNDRWPK